MTALESLTTVGFPAVKPRNRLEQLLRAWSALNPASTVVWVCLATVLAREYKENSKKLLSAPGRRKTDGSRQVTNAFGAC